eukprot:1148238-Pelagomonas_calceolata.AAC.5
MVADAAPLKELQKNCTKTTTSKERNRLASSLLTPQGCKGEARKKEKRRQGKKREERKGRQDCHSAQLTSLLGRASMRAN